MLRRLLGASALVLITLAFPVACGPEGPHCCALKRFCTVCTTCTSNHLATANRHDEAACEVEVEKFKSMKQFCNPEDKPPQHSIEEFVLQCGD